MKYYNSLIEYAMENGLPKAARWEVWFTPYNVRHLMIPIPDLKAFVENFSHEVILRGECEVRTNPYNNDYSCIASEYAHFKAKQRGYAFFVMISDGGTWLCRNPIREFVEDDSFTVNARLKPVTKPSLFNKICEKLCNLKKKS